jgi:hypothetical protein
VLERPQVGRSVVRDPGQQPDPLLGIFQLAVTLSEQGNASLIPGEGVFEIGRAVLQVAEDALEFGERLFKPDRFGIGRGHEIASCAGEGGHP